MIGRCPPLFRATADDFLDLVKKHVVSEELAKTVSLRDWHLMWHARFKNGDQEFLAIGENRDLMDVYRLESGRVVRTPISFPNCLKFMPYAEIDEETAGQKTPEWIEETYGPIEVVEQNDP